MSRLAEVFGRLIALQQAVGAHGARRSGSSLLKHERSLLERECSLLKRSRAGEPLLPRHRIRRILTSLRPERTAIRRRRPQCSLVNELLFMTRADLRAAGYTLARIQAEIALGLLERIIRGWYCRPGADRGAVKALRLGGRLSCVSALRLLGAWVPPDLGTHVGFPSHASGRRMVNGRAAMPADVVTHWHPKAAATGSGFAITPIARCIEDLLTCQPPHIVVAVLDSLLHRHLIQRNRLDALILAGPQRMRFIADHLHPASESGIESIVRFRLAVAGIVADVQVVFREQYRLDLVIDGWLVLEIDGRETHTQRGAFTKDRVRAATIMREGRIVLQFAYATVMHDWDFVLTAVQDVMRQHAPVRG